MGGTFKKLEEIFRRDSSVAAIVDFFKNAGRPAALTAATCLASGKAFLYMDRGT